MLSVSRYRVYIYVRFPTHMVVITNCLDVTLKASSSTRTLTSVPKFTTCDTDQTDQPWMLLRPTSRDGTTNMKRETITRHVIPCGLAGWEQGQPKDNHRQPDEPLSTASCLQAPGGQELVHDSWFSSPRDHLDSITCQLLAVDPVKRTMAAYDHESVHVHVSFGWAWPLGLCHSNTRWVYLSSTLDIVKASGDSIIVISLCSTHALTALP